MVFAKSQIKKISKNIMINQFKIILNYNKLLDK